MSPILKLTALCSGEPRSESRVKAAGTAGYSKIQLETAELDFLEKMTSSVGSADPRVGI